ncbi:hypothetical protein L249_4960, partial [Ophiocordyceps polyrhachis-furcata BCC 54312]
MELLLRRRLELFLCAYAGLGYIMDLMHFVELHLYSAISYYSHTIVLILHRSTDYLCSQVRLKIPSARCTVEGLAGTSWLILASPAVEITSASPLR